MMDGGKKSVKRVFLYVRVSTEEQAVHGLSIDAQTRALEDWAGSNGHFIVGTYIDAGISARKPASKRPALQRLLADVQAGKGDLIVFTKLDRWFRNIAEYYKVQEVLERRRVDWRTIHEDYDTSTASGRLKVNIMLSVAQDEADRTSERIKAINELKRQKREPLTGSCPPGYKIEGRRYIRDPETEAATRAFFQKFMACGSIARTLAHMREEFGLAIGYQKADKMLRNPCYYGRYFGVEHMTPPYLTKEEYDRIQAMRRRVVRKTAHNRIYLFSGLMSCGECGRRMGCRVNTKQESHFYNCASHYMSASRCGNGVNLTERKIETFLLDAIQTSMGQWRLTGGAMVRSPCERDYKGEAAALRARLGRLKELYLNSLISLEEYRDGQRAYTGQLDALLQEERRQARPDFAAAGRLLAENWREQYAHIQPWQRQEFWRILVREIRIYGDRHIECDWNGPLLCDLPNGSSCVLGDK